MCGGEKPSWVAGKNDEWSFEESGADVEILLGALASLAASTAETFLTGFPMSLLSIASDMKTAVATFGHSKTTERSRKALVSYDADSSTYASMVITKTHVTRKVGVPPMRSSTHTITITARVRVATAKNEAASAVCQALIDAHINGGLLPLLEEETIFGEGAQPGPVPPDPAAAPLSEAAGAGLVQLAGAGVHAAEELRRQRQREEQVREKFKPSEDLIAQVDEELLDMAQECRVGSGFGDQELVDFLESWLQEADCENRDYAREMFFARFGIERDVGQDSNQSLGDSAKLQEALAELQRAKDAAHSRNDAQDFEQLNSHSMDYDEQGRSITGDRGTTFHSQSNLGFADLIRPQVFKILRYLGSFRTFMTSELFMDDRSNNVFYFRASAKVPFLCTHYGCPAIGARLMHKYLENPFNPAILASYKPGINLKAALEGGGEGVERTIHLADAYLQMRSEEPFLICAGPPGTRKSTLLNSLFGLQFETLQKGSIGLFHDAAEVFFNSESFPAGFNVVDLQGHASLDMRLLEMLLTRMPRSLLLILLSEVDYVDNVIGKLPSCLRTRLAERVFVILRFNGNKKVVPKARACLNKVVGKGATIFDLGDELAGEAAVENKLQNGLSQVQDFVNGRGDVLEQQRSHMLTASRRSNSGPDAEAFSGLHGSFWITFEQMSEQCSGLHSDFRVQQLPGSLRGRHVEMKRVLRSLEDTNPKKLERTEVFPCYSQYLELVRIRRELEDRKTLSKDRVETLERRRRELDGKKPTPSDIFYVFFQSYMEAKTCEYPDICADLMALVEAAYVPRITGARKRLKEAKDDIESLSKKLSDLRRKMEADVALEASEELQKEVKGLHNDQEVAKSTLQSALKEMESKVLDSELFLREAKHYTKDNEELRRKLVKKLGSDFQAGRPLEIIDGDSNKIDKEMLEAVFQWVHDIQENSRKLVVITILGPQSSGKSTLLNYLFGAKFHVSAGRCTKGLNAMLLRTDLEDIKEVLVLDSEGIFSIEKQDPTYDRKLAIFCMSVSNVLLINIKGELSAEVQKVMEVAIYACTKIVESRAALKVPKIMFVLRDQISGDMANMDAAYSKLKSQMRGAAEASGTELDDVLYMPENGKDIVFLLQPALTKRRVNKSDVLEITESNGGFRDQCAKLRSRLLKSCSKLREEEKNDNLVSWIKGASSVWTAVQEQEQLSMIVDLKEINNHRNLMKALGDFRILMSTLPVTEQDSKPPKTHPHPLLIHSKSVVEHFIPPCKTVFQEFSCKIDEMLAKQSELRNKQGARADNAEEMRKLQRRQEESMGQFREELTNVQAEYAREFSQDFGPNLQRQAESSVRHIVESIYQKAMTKWKKETASKTIDGAAQDMLEQLKMTVFDSKRKGNQLSKEKFAVEAERLLQLTSSDLQGFLKSEEQVCNEAFRDLEDSSGRSGDGDSFSFIQLRHLQNDRVRTPTLLDCSERDGPRPVPNALKAYFELDENKAENAISSFVMRQPWCKEHRERINARKEATKNSNFASRGYQAVAQALRAEQAAPEVSEEQHNRRFEQEVAKVLEEVKATALQVATSRFKALREKVQDCIRLADEANSESHSPQPLLEKARAQLFEAFNKELKEMTDANKSGGRADTHEEIAKQCMMYKFEGCQQLFTRVYFNLLHNQVVRNEALQKEYMEKKLDSKKTEALEFFDEINRSVEGAQGCSGVLMTVLVGALSAVLELAFKADLQTALDNLTIDKSWVQQKAMAAFEDADASAEGQQTIIDFMKHPVELEERIVRKEYDEKTKDKRDHLVGQYDQEVAKAVANIQEFFENLNQRLGTDREQVSDVRDEEAALQKRKRNETVLHFLYWSVLWQFQNVSSAADGSKMSGQDMAKCLRCEAESYQIWGKHISFPDVGERLFKNNPDNYNANADQARLVDLSGTLRYEDMSVFMMSLSDFSQNEEVKQKLGAARESLLLELNSVVSSNDYESFRSAGIGCRGVCDFCGARCNSLTECDTSCNHTSEFHRPMAFKGSHKKEADEKGRPQKILLQDFCTSPTNIKSLWRAKNRGNPDGAGIVDALQRLEELDLKTDGMNVYLEWSTTADLDINVMCACGDWHGYGTTGGSGGECECTTCGMKRDYDVRQGIDGRTAIEHVYFENPQLLVNKPIGVGVHNYGDSANRSHNPFKICIFNQWAHQLFPNPGVPEARHEAGWMFTGGPNTDSEKKTYLFKAADLNAGRENHYVEFPRHVQDMGARWEFSQAGMTNRREDPKFQKFIKQCNEKWQIVKEQICKDYNAKLLDQVMVL